MGREEPVLTQGIRFSADAAEVVWCKFEVIAIEPFTPRAKGQV